MTAHYDPVANGGRANAPDDREGFPTSVPSGADPSASADSPQAHEATVAKLGDVAAAAGLRRVHMIAWRDLEDVEAGGSEVHAATIARLWAEAGVEVFLRTSYAQGQPPTIDRDGYQVRRKGGRYQVFPRAAVREMLRLSGPYDGLVEIWNGMPFFSPLWARGPRITFLHHVHREMWRMVLPPNLAAMGDLIERRVAPVIYRRTRVVTPAESTKRELVDDLGFRADKITVVPNGVDDVFRPGGEKSPRPLVVAVGRLVPVKRYHLLIDVLVRLKSRIPDLEAVIVGTGYEHLALERQIQRHQADGWLSLPGRVSQAQLVELYQRAWAVTSTSIREGWGLTVTEAAACGTPSVVTRISGHLDSVVHGETGLLCDGHEGVSDGLAQVLTDRALRDRLGAGALAHSAQFTWDNTALGVLEALAAEAHRSRRSGADRR